MANFGRFKGKPITEMLEERVTFVSFPLFQRCVSVTSDKDRCFWVFISQLFKSHFKLGKFMDKFIIKATGGEIDRDVNSDGVAGYAENKHKESASCYRDYGDKRVQASFPEGKSSPMGLSGCESKSLVKLVVRIETVAVVRLENCGG